MRLNNVVVFSLKTFYFRQVVRSIELRNRVSIYKYIRRHTNIGRNRDQNIRTWLSIFIFNGSIKRKTVTNHSFTIVYVQLLTYQGFPHLIPTWIIWFYCLINFEVVQKIKLISYRSHLFRRQLNERYICINRAR